MRHDSCIPTSLFALLLSFPFTSTPIPHPQSLILVRPCSNVGNICRVTPVLEAGASISTFHRNPMHPRTPHPSATPSIWAPCLCSSLDRTEAQQLPSQMRTEKKMVNLSGSDTNRKNIRVFCYKLIYRIPLLELFPSHYPCRQKKSAFERRLPDAPAWSVI